MCHQFGYSKQAYYKQLKGTEEIVLKEQAVFGLIKKNGKSGSVAAAEICTRV